MTLLRFRVSWRSTKRPGSRLWASWLFFSTFMSCRANSLKVLQNRVAKSSDQRKWCWRRKVTWRANPRISIAHLSRDSTRISWIPWEITRWMNSSTATWSPPGSRSRPHSPTQVSKVAEKNLLLSSSFGYPYDASAFVRFFAYQLKPWSINHSWS